jgi:acylphosphatase
MVRYHIIVKGYVQGVGFRYFVRITAFNYGIGGWVRNNINGSVEIDAEGNEVNMRAFIEAVKKGNKYSSVEELNFNEVKEFENFRSFDIADNDF